MNNPSSLFRKSIRIAFLVGSVFLIGGLGGVYFDRVLLPRLITSPRFAHWEALKPVRENVTVVNRIEEVIIREDDALDRIVAQPSTAVVNIIISGKPSKQYTGVLLTNDGLVVTYAPDQESQNSASILLFDGKNYPARFVAIDTLTGLVYYRIEGVNTPTIALANSDDSRVGRKLIAIGNSAGEYQNRLSLGILGNKNRTFNLSGKTVASSEKWEGVFEMDMPQAKEFVGGPAIGFNGEMVGLVASLQIDQQERFFLLPANAVRDSLSRLLANGSFMRPTLGVYYLPVTKAYALAEGMDRDRGALIYSASGKTGLAVIAGSPAERAGLRYGDMIIAVNGEEVNLDRPLSTLIGRLKKGDVAEFLVLRNDIEIKVPVQL